MTARPNSTGLWVWPTTILFLAFASAARAQDAGTSPDAGAGVDAGVAATLDGGPDSDSGAEAEAAPLSDSEVESRVDTGVRGRIVDGESGRTLPQAPVLVQGGGRTETTLTDGDGRYVLGLTPGRYTVRSYYDLHHGARLDGVRVFAGRLAEVNLSLDPIGDEEVVVAEQEVFYRADATTAAAQDQIRKESSGIGEGMGAQQMSQQGASDASQAAARVVGVNLSKRQLVIRGLGGRYTRVLVNDVAVPGTDPDRPGVDLDLFPTSVVESLTVSKAFLPDLPADFAGGLLQIHTVTFPRDFTLEVGLSAGANTQSTFRDRLTYEGGGLDWLGADDGTRSLPDGIPDERVQISRHGPYRTRESIEEAGELFPNTWQYRRRTALPKIGLEANVGDSVAFGGGNRFGYTLAIGYDYDTVRETGISRPRPTIAEDGSLSAFNDFRNEVGAEEVSLVTLGTGSLEIGSDHALTVLAMYNRSATDETTLQRGQSGELAAGEEVERWQLRYVARALSFNQLIGDHRNLFGTRLRLRWRGFAAVASRDEPDRRTVIYGPQGGQFRWLEKANSGERFFSNLDQRDFGGTLSLRFPLWSEAWGTVGGRVHTAGRELVNRRFRMLQDPSATDQSAYSAPVEELFSREGIGTLTRIREFTRADDNYSSRQTLYAAFAMLETPIAGGLSFAGGARLEVAEQRVQSHSPFPEENDEPIEENRTDRTDLDVLPGLALKYALTESMFVRAAYGLTVARPQIRELAPYQYYDFLRDRNVQGNPDLERTLIHNADLRWEWFFGEGEVLAVSGFFKDFKDPIELQILNPDNYDAQFVNADGARAYGGELELRVGLGRIAPALEHFQLGGNVAFIASQVELSEELSGAVRGKRRMFGQAPYVTNLSLRFDLPDPAVGVGLVYNVVGPRISDVGTRVGDQILPNIEEQPFHSLDLVAHWQFHEHFKLKLKMKNLLLEAKDLRQGGFLTQRVDPGASITLGLSYVY